MIQVTATGVLGLVAVLLCFALAVTLFRTGMPGSVARRLALLLVVEGLVLLTSGVYFDFLPPDLAERLAGSVWDQVNFSTHTLLDCAMLALYPPFLAASLRTGLTRPFASRRARLLLGLFAVGLLVSVVSLPYQVGISLLYATMASLFAFALVASIHAWAVTAPGMARTRAGVFALAFGFRDVCWLFVYAVGAWIVWSGTDLRDDTPAYLPYMDLVYRLGTLLYVPTIAYGILRTQLFDIDLRIRWTIKQSTLAGVVVAIVYLISEGADRLLSSELGNVAGLLAAAVVVFFLAPLQRFAERVANVAMPNTRDTPEYAAFRKLQVYESAVADALQEGGISTKERTLLEHLRNSLGVSEADAAAIEAELRSRADGEPTVAAVRPA